MAEGFKIADAYVEIEAELDRDRLAASVSSSVSKASTKIKNDSGRKLGTSLLEGVGDSFATGFKSAVSLGFSGLSGLGSALASNPITATIGIALGAAIAGAALPAIAAVLTSGLALLAGAAVLGVGALILKNNKKIQKQFEKSWGNITKNLQKAAEPLVKPFVEALATLDDIVRELTPELKALFKAAAPIVGIITKAIGPTLKPIIDGLKDAMPGITAAFDGLAKSLPGIGESIGNFFRTIFKDKDLIARVTEGFGNFISFLIDIAGPALRFFTLLWGALTNAATLFKKFLSEDISDALARFETFTGGALGRIVQAWAPLKEAIGRVWDAFVEFANANTDAERNKTFVKLIDSIKLAWGPLKTFFGTVFDEAWAAVKKVWNEKVVPWWNNTAEPWIKEKIKAGVKSAFTAAGEAIKTEIGTWPGKILGGLGVVVSTTKNTIVNGFAGAGSWLIQAGKSILQGLIDGINAKLGSLKTLLSTVTGLIPSWKGPMSVDKKLLFPTGQAIMGGLESGLMSGTTSLERTLQGLTAAIPSMAATPAPAGGPSLVVNNPVFFGAGSKDEFIRWMNKELDRLKRSYSA